MKEWRMCVEKADGQHRCLYCCPNCSSYTWDKKSSTLL